MCSPLSSQTLFIPQVPFPGLSLSLARTAPLGKFISPEAPLLIISQLLEEADEQPWSMLPDCLSNTSIKNEHTNKKQSNFLLKEVGELILSTYFSLAIQAA